MNLIANNLTYKPSEEYHPAEVHQVESACDQLLLRHWMTAQTVSESSTSVFFSLF